MEHIEGLSLKNHYNLINPGGCAFTYLVDVFGHQGYDRSRTPFCLYYIKYKGIDGEFCLKLQLLLS